MRTPILASMLSFLLGATGCVSAGKYDAAVADAQAARSHEATEHDRLTKQLDARNAVIAANERDSQEVQARCREVEAALSEKRAASASCTRALDETVAVNDALRKELTRRGQDVDKLVAAKGSLSASLDETRARLEEIRRAQTAAEVRAAIFQEVARRLKRMIDAGDLAIGLRSGRMVLVMPADVLFDSGKDKIKSHGEETLAQIAEALRSLEGRRFQVAGHTDNQPIRVSHFASNWELSVARALRVVEFLVEKGMDPAALSAAGYGEFDAVAPNEAPVDQSKNRRIEITLQPNIDEVIGVP